jgi:peptidoglycan-associated lipoprotein
MKFLFPALCWAVLLGGFACAKRPAIHPVQPPAAPRGEPFQEDAPQPDEIARPIHNDKALDMQPKGPIYFAFDSFSLKELDKAHALADYMRAHPAKSVDLAGHCSQEGANDYNLALGARRAQTVRDYLAAAGIAEHRISWKSFGEESPVTEDPAQYHLNRRVEFLLEDPQ